MMSSVRAAAIAALSLCALQSASAAESDVKQLSLENWMEYKYSDFMLVEFYAPWCGHCKKLAPEYEAAATSLKASHPKVVMVKVDATRETEIATKYEVAGYPTLKWFKAGVASDYNGGRTEEEIIAWVKKKTQPPLMEIKDVESLALFRENKGVVAVAYITDKSSAEYKAVSAAADIAEAVSFGVLSDTSLMDPGFTPPTIVMYKDDGDTAKFEGEFSAENINKWVEVEGIPATIEFTEANMQTIFGEKGKEMLHLFLFTEKGADYHEPAVKALRDAYSEYKGNIMNVIVDTNSAGASRIVDFFDIGTSPPVLRGFDSAKNQKFSPATAFKPTKEYIAAFGKQFRDGKVAAKLKSEPEPTSQAGPVTAVVGTTFDKLVMDESKNVFLELYAPWCGHCKKLAPVFDELGEVFSNSQHIVIAKMDGTANEVDGLQVKGFPTLKFYRAGSKPDREGEAFEGDRTLAAMKKWIDLHVRAPDKEDL